MTTDVNVLVQNILGKIITLQEVHTSAEELSAWPGSAGVATSSTSGSSSPTETRAITGRNTYDRDQVAASLQRIDRALDQELARYDAQVPSSPCTCCRDALATHGALCWDCLDFRKRTGQACTPEFHEDIDERPHRHRECECPTWCCPEGCMDLVAPSTKRRVSDRCRQRMYRFRKDSSDAVSA